MNQEQQLMGPYAKEISTSMVLLGEAVSRALNMRDIKVLKEMKAVCGEIFEQAERVLKDENQTIQ